MILVVSYGDNLMNTLFKTIPKLAWIFSAHNPLRFLKIMIQLWYVLISAELLGGDSCLNIKCTYNGIDFVFSFSSKADIAVMKEVFIWEEYNWELDFEPKTILDLGAHVGDTALYYHVRYPNAQIYAVEPDPVLYARLQENVASIPNIHTVQAGVGKESGYIAFHRSNTGSLGGSLLDRQGSSDAIMVGALTLDDLYTKLGLTNVDLFKFDIEGAEEYLFVKKSAKEYARAFIGELHYDLMSVDESTFMQAFSGFTFTTRPLGRKGRLALRALITKE